jgi:glycosyltransferase involved in cell wall biosynthesis
MRTLFLLPGPNAPRSEPHLNRFHYLAKHLEADVLQPAWRDDHQRLRHLSHPEHAGPPRIRFHYTASGGLPQPLRTAWDIAFYVMTALDLMRGGHRYDAIVAFGMIKTALAAWVLARLTGSKLVLEIAVRPDRAARYRRARPRAFETLKDHLANRIAAFLLPRADHLRLMYPGQVDAFPKARHVPATAFPDFVATSQMKPQADSGFVLLMGSPLYLKGADLAVAAFRKIAEEFPADELRIVGYAPDIGHFKALAGNHPRIRFSAPVPYPQALELIGRATCLVVASRSDAMPRIALEAMAMRKPVIASAVDGMAHYLQHGKNALLFESGDADGLASVLRQVLGDRAFARSLAERGYRWVQNNMSETQYAERFRAMIEATLIDRSRSF